MGADFIQSYGFVIDLRRTLLYCEDRKLTVPLVTRDERIECEEECAYTAEDVLIGPRTASLVPCSVRSRYSGEGVFESTLKLEMRGGYAARSLVTVAHGSFQVVVLNTGEQQLRVPRNMLIGKISSRPVEPVYATEPCESNSTRRADELERILRNLVSGIADENLNDEQRHLLFELLWSFRDVFAVSKYDLGRTKILRHKITLSDNARPVRQPLRRLNPRDRNEVSALLKDMLKSGLIEPSDSPWAAGVVPVRKKDGSLRLCVDYRKLNELTRKDAYPLPRIDETLDSLSGARFFSTIDLLSGYWQVELEPDAKEKTAFITHDGLFHFTVMPFGLTGAPATFQRLMELVLAGVKWESCLVYLDDVIVFSRTFEEHLQRLAQVLLRFRRAGLKISPSKCQFLRQEVTYLGHSLSTAGIRPDPRLTERIRDYPTPTCLHELQSFLGLASYYRRFIRRFAEIAAPLHRLTRKETAFAWSQEADLAFRQLRQALTSESVLRFPDFAKPFILDTDASSVAIGAVLSQLDEEGREHPVAFASRALSRSEQKYCVTRREMLAVVTFIQYFAPYLQNEFTLRTDHGSLRWLQSFKDPDGQWARWQEKLQSFRFKIVHRPDNVGVKMNGCSRTNK
uniref:RNA-directed DNA polymerase n=1 Tax=Trichuris muris TaxID=70415 RepID=A0A5S6R1V4_TRIMR